MKYSPTQYAKALYDLTAKASGHQSREVVARLARFLDKQNSLYLERDIREAFKSYARKKEGVSEVKIKAASETTSKDLAKHFGKENDVEVSVEPALLGGAMIEIDGTRIDNSVKRRLAGLKKLGQ